MTLITTRRDQPDIIMLMTDQQRWDALGCVDSAVRTPHLDRIAASGIRFTQAVCQAPLCVPSRISFMTGLYPSQLGLAGNDDPTPDDDRLPIAPLPEMLRQAGYVTAGFGKTHWGRTSRPVSTRGFATRVVGCREVGEELGVSLWQDELDPAGLAQYRHEVANYGPGEEAAAGYLGARSNVESRNHRDGWVAEQARRWLLEDKIDPGKPLFFYLSFLKPHAGLNPPAEFADLYDERLARLPPVPPWRHEPATHLSALDRASEFHRSRYEEWVAAFTAGGEEAWRTTVARYHANCSWLDSLLGGVLDALEKAGRLDNALIVFLSDHGEMLGERNLRFSKYCLYESSVRVPLVLGGSALPGSLRGTTSSRLAELVDVYPTLAAAAGVRAAPVAVGQDLLGCGNGRRGAFSEVCLSGMRAWMWRDASFKLIKFKEANAAHEAGEFYDLRNDPHEWRNLYGRQDVKSRQETFERELQERISRLGDLTADLP